MEDNPFEPPDSPTKSPSKIGWTRPVRPEIAWSLLGAMLGTGVIGLLVLSSDPRERLMGGLVIGAFPGAMIGWFVGKRFGV